MQAIRGSNGKSYRCDSDDSERLAVIDARLERRGRGITPMRRRLKRMDRRYPGRAAPPKIAARYNRLLGKLNARVDAVNEVVREYNATLEAECDEDSGGLGIVGGGRRRGGRRR